MNVIDIEKLNQLISRTDISGNDKVKWLTDFIDGREPQQQNRMYSEEDMKQFAEWLIKVNFNYTSNTTDVFLIWKKQFKKK
jgi:hypothetical protein